MKGPIEMQSFSIGQSRLLGHQSEAGRTAFQAGELIETRLGSPASCSGVPPSLLTVRQVVRSAATEFYRVSYLFFFVCFFGSGRTEDDAGRGTSRAAAARRR